MLSYVSSTRKKSCRSCVKSKRRCDLTYPCCHRCLSKGIECTYPSTSAKAAKITVRQTSPDPVPLADNIVVGELVELLQDQPSDIHVDPAVFPSSNPGSSPDSYNSRDDLSRSSTCVEPRLYEPLPQIWEPIILDRPQIVFIVQKLSSFIPSMAFSGNTLFIHESLYQVYQPSAYTDSVSLSALYLMKSDKNLPILANAINSKISSLIASSKHWTLSEHLAAVQALVIYQIIRLFDSDQRLQHAAARQNNLLEVWTAHLWKRIFNNPNAFTTCHESWIFYESLRRTVLISVFIRGVWGALTNGGLCTQVPVLANLPFSKDARLWDCDLAEWTDREPCATQCLQAYGDMSSRWIPGEDVGILSEFERLLLGACRGQEDPALLIG